MNLVKTYIFIAVVATIMIFGGGRYAYIAATTETVTDTFVRDSERVCKTSTEDCRYIAFGENETYENTDEFLFFKFNSSDVNKSLIKGATCEMKVYGLRIPFLSWYRNIIEAKCSS